MKKSIMIVGTRTYEDYKAFKKQVDEWLNYNVINSEINSNTINENLETRIYDIPKNPNSSYEIYKKLNSELINLLFTHIFLFWIFFSYYLFLIDNIKG